MDEPGQDYKYDGNLPPHDPVTFELIIYAVLIAASLILLIGFALRAAFGLFQIPIADEFGWLRAEFS